MTQHGRDQLSQNWPKLYTSEQSAQLPAEEIVQLEARRRLRLAGMLLRSASEKARAGAGIWRRWRQEESASAPRRTAPVAAFPGHWAPNDLLIYSGRHFPPLITAARLSPSMARGIARPSRRAAITSSSSRSTTARRRRTSSSSPTDLPARSKSRAKRRSGLQAWRWDRTARSISPRTCMAASGA